MAIDGNNLGAGRTRRAHRWHGSGTQGVHSGWRDFPAQPLLDIVPVSERLVEEARIPATAIDDLMPGSSRNFASPLFAAVTCPKFAAC